jgi:hypothetical protein
MSEAGADGQDRFAPRELTEEDRIRLLRPAATVDDGEDGNSNFGNDENENEEEEEEEGAGLDSFEDDNKVVEIVNPSMLRMMLHSAESRSRREDGGWAPRSLDHISLSGCRLVSEGGEWHLSPKTRWHAKPPEGGEQKEVFVLPPNVRVTFFCDCRQWYVPDPYRRRGTGAADLAFADDEAGGTRVPVPDRPLSPKLDPAADIFLRRGGMKFLHPIEDAVKNIVAFACGTEMETDETAQEGEAAIMQRCDDSQCQHMGVLVRRDFCNALVRILAHNMYRTRLGGLVRVTVWDIIQSATPKPGAATLPEMRRAYLAMRDLETNPNMHNNVHIRVRSFICASLNHHFLEHWLMHLHSNHRLLGKHYEPISFLRLCPPASFEELLLTLNPLMMLPFRLHTVFEVSRIVSRQVKASMKREQAASAAARAAARFGGGAMAEGSRAMSVVGGRRLSRISVLERHEYTQYGNAPDIGAAQIIPEDFEPGSSEGDDGGGWADTGGPVGGGGWDPTGRGAGGENDLGGGWGDEGAAAHGIEARLAQSTSVYARANYTNDVPEDDIELSFQRGDIMQVHYNPQSSPGWLSCSIGDRSGLVPVNYIDFLDELEAMAHMTSTSYT